tara:strand:+ start:16208 stop:16897 length:690 start_codon:yes stop_codon:yes gene_type:complete
MKTIFKLENATVNEIITQELETLLKLHNNVEHAIQEYEIYSQENKKQKLLNLKIPQGLTIDLIYGALLLFEKDCLVNVDTLEYLQLTFITVSSELYKKDTRELTIDNYYNLVFNNLRSCHENKTSYLNLFYESCAYINKLSDITFVLGGDFAFQLPNCLLIMLSDPEAANKLMTPYTNSDEFFGEFDDIYYKAADILSEETKGEVIQKRFKEMLNAHVEKLTPVAVCKA